MPDTDDERDQTGAALRYMQVRAARGESSVMEMRASLSITTEDQAVLTRAVEVLSRAQLGLALEGMSAFLMIGPEDEEG